jgi:hypothetical protein
MLVTKGDSRNSAVVESRSTARRRQSLFFRRFFLFVLAGLVAIFSVLPRLTPPPPPDWSSLLPPSTDRDEPLQALVLTAHPDDECMFFSPTILSLVEQQAHVRALCLSSGTTNLHTLSVYRAYNHACYFGYQCHQVTLQELVVAGPRSSCQATQCSV